jgi:hypothetical protein
MRKLLIIGALVAPLAIGAGFAQSPATPSSPKPAETKATKASKALKARADECTKQANAKKLHGAERKKFRASCKEELSKKS